MKIMVEKCCENVELKLPVHVLIVSSNENHHLLDLSLSMNRLLYLFVQSLKSLCVFSVVYFSWNATFQMSDIVLKRSDPAWP